MMLLLSQKPEQRFRVSALLHLVSRASDLDAIEAGIEGNDMCEDGTGPKIRAQAYYAVDEGGVPVQRVARNARARARNLI